METPAILTVFALEVSPAMISTELLGTANVLARSLMSSSLAAPSTGGDASFTFQAAPCSPTISDREALGATRTVIVMPSLFSVNQLI